MEPARHEFKVGKLVVHGPNFEFRPEPSVAFAAKPGDVGDIYLLYGYHEASREKETFNLRFTVELGGRPLGTQRATVKDHRLVTDEQWGLLKHEVALNAKGTLKGRYTIEAMYEKGPWNKGATGFTPFHASGEFTLAVR